jgi:hypothetical protein
MALNEPVRGRRKSGERVRKQRPFKVPFARVE